MSHTHLPEEEEETLVGRRLFGEYTVTQKLGEGGMGAVYLLQQARIDQKIAVKVLHGRSADNDELVQRFNLEAKAVSMLTHPNIIRVFIFGKTEDDLIYLAMEYIRGDSLRKALEGGPMSELRAIKIMKQVLSALAEAHDLGIIHRDLKPDNILLTEYRGKNDFVKVLDFGIAKIKEPTGAVPQQKLTQAGVVYGTPEYLSPEQAQALELDFRTDLYSLGIILYEMVTGRVPFEAPTAVTVLTMHVFEQAKSPREVLPSVSAEMERVILKAIAKKPGDRYQNATEFMEALEELEVRLGGGRARSSAPLMSSGGSVASDSSYKATEMISVKHAGESDAPAENGTVRKVLIGLIVVSVVLLLVLIGVIVFVISMK